MLTESQVPALFDCLPT